MNKKEFYAALMSKYTFDNEKIRKNAISVAESLDIDMLAGCCPGLKSYGSADVNKGVFVAEGFEVSAEAERDVCDSRAVRERRGRQGHFEFVNFRRKFMPALTAAAAVAVFAGVFAVFNATKVKEVDYISEAAQAGSDYTLSSDVNGNSAEPETGGTDSGVVYATTVFETNMPVAEGTTAVRGYPSATSSSQKHQAGVADPTDTTEVAAAGDDGTTVSPHASEDGSVPAVTEPKESAPGNAPRNAVYISDDRIVKAYEDKIVLSDPNAEGANIIASAAAKSPNLYMFSGRGATVATAVGNGNDRNRLFIIENNSIYEVNVKDIVGDGEIYDTPFYDREDDRVFLTVRNADRVTLYVVYSKLMGTLKEGKGSGDVASVVIASAANVQLLSVALGFNGSYVYAVTEAANTVIKTGSFAMSSDDKTLATLDTANTRIDVSPNFTSFVVVDRAKGTSVYNEFANTSFTPKTAPPVVGVTDLKYSDDGTTLSSAVTGKIYKFDGANLAVVGTLDVTPPAETEEVTTAVHTTTPAATTTADVSAAVTTAHSGEPAPVAATTASSVSSVTTPTAKIAATTSSPAALTPAVAETA